MRPWLEHLEQLLGLVDLVHRSCAAGIGLEHLPAVDEGHAVRLQAVPALSQPRSFAVLGEGHEADR
jgi:hypothetical protein